MPTTADFKKNFRILLDGEPYSIVEHTLQSPTARGSATLVRAKLRNMLTGQLLDKTFKSGENFDAPDLVFRPAQFLYRDGEDLHFMDEESYEQFHLQESRIEEVAPSTAVQANGA